MTALLTEQLLDDPAPDARTRRREAGRWLKSLRERAGLTQADVATRLKLRYYTFVSQVEGGYGRVPPEQIASWAATLGVSPRSMARELMRHYDPETHRLLFDPAFDDGTTAGADAALG